VHHILPVVGGRLSTSFVGSNPFGLFSHRVQLSDTACSHILRSQLAIRLNRYITASYIFENRQHVAEAGHQLLERYTTASYIVAVAGISIRRRARSLVTTFFIGSAPHVAEAGRLLLNRDSVVLPSVIHVPEPGRQLVAVKVLGFYF
jgi:hypothetical protein